MALIRLCGGYNTVTLKLLTDWKLSRKVYDISLLKSKFSKKWSQFTKRKLNSNTKESLLAYSKLGLGITTGVVIKVLGDNRVFCISDLGTRLGGSSLKGAKTSFQEPQFNWKKFFKLLQPYWAELLGAILTALICAILNIQIPRALGHLVDVLNRSTGSTESFMIDMKKPAIHLFLYYALQSLFTFLYISLLSNVGEEIAMTMKTQFFSSVMNQDIAFFDETRTGEIVNRFTIDIQDFKSSFKTVISQGLRSITEIFGSCAILFFISPPMSGFMVVVVPTMIIFGTFLGSFLRQLSYKVKTQGAQLTLIAEEAISNVRTIRSLAMEELKNKLVRDELEIHKNLSMKLGYGIAMFQAGTNLFLNGVVLSTIYIGGYMVSTGNISAGDLMAFLMAVRILQSSFSKISILFGTYIKGKQAGARVFEIIDLKPGKTLVKGKIIPFHSLVPNVEYKDVVFKYPSRPQKEVLKKVSLEIPAGKTVAIVGSSGSGKSTLAWLLEKFYDVNEGTIKVGGENISLLNSNWLRRNVLGFISQEPVLFATTIMENIRYGKITATDDEVIEAAKSANAHDFIQEFPDGYHTMVGERGVSVSGGQKQRIAIARALLKNPTILILDEATSALDAESEKLVQQALDKVTKSRTTIVIAHRLSTIKNADLIVVLSEGKVIESGTHAELLQKNGMYSSLVCQQVRDS